MIDSTAYYNDFWNEMRGKQAVTDSLYNNRESKTNAYHLPGESNKKYTAVLRKESAVRQLATVVNATRSDSRLWTFDCEGQAEWGDMVNLEGMDNEDDFQRFEVQAYRLSELVRLGLEFASDQHYILNMPLYLPSFLEAFISSFLLKYNYRIIETELKVNIFVTHSPLFYMQHGNTM